ncbi:Ig-like domain-containing protein [Butyrivibrio sp. JL13D10]|uniref:Ig-like domain-containing protein n=1 Tax=Butyrivibrio sp. JL13D10 TaxID=3236815 RepID=UPI0038B5DBD7
MNMKNGVKQTILCLMVSLAVVPMAVHLPGASYSVRAASGDTVSVSNYSELKSAIDNCIVNDELTIKLKNDVTGTGRVDVDKKKINLDLNGYTLNLNYESGTQAVIEIKRNGAFTLQDSRDTGKILGGSTGVSNNGGTFIMNGGTIYGGSRYCIDNYNNGEVIINGGALKGLTANTTGIANNESRLKITGGSVSGCYEGIYNSPESTLEITGGTISQNKGRSGIFNAGSLTISGNPNISSNTNLRAEAKNIYLYKTNMKVGTMTNTVPIGVSLYYYSEGAFTTGGVAANYEKNFISDNALYMVKKQQDELSMVVDYTPYIPVVLSEDQKPTARTGLVENGQPQLLLNAPKVPVTGRTMYYAIGPNTGASPATGWTEAIPQATGAGRYYVWYLVIADTGLIDVSPTCINVQIGKNGGSQGPQYLPEDDPYDPYDDPEELYDDPDDDPDDDPKDDPDPKDKTGDDPKVDPATPTDPSQGQNQAGFYSGLKIKQKSGKIKVSWDKTEGMSKYEVFITYLGKKYPKKAVKTTAGNSVNIKKIKGKKIDLTKNFKIRVDAYDSTGKKAGQSVTAFVAGKYNAKYKNPKSIRLTTNSLTLGAGQNAKIGASVKMEKGNRKAIPNKKVPKLRYISANEAVAKVDKNGNVTGITKGTCKVYVFAKNGLAGTVMVTVD